MADQQITSYFIETSVPTGNVGGKWGQHGYCKGVTAESAVLSNTANTLVSYPIGYTAASTAPTVNLSSIPKNYFSGLKIPCGIDITVAYDDVVAICAVQCSYDGTSWVNAATVVADTTPNVTGVKQGLADLTSTYAPYFRLAFNTSGLNCGTSGKLKFFYTIPNPDNL